MSGFWNYRVVQHRDNGETHFMIHECHYGEDQRGERKPVPHSVTEQPVPAASDTGAGIFEVLQMMSKATALPAIDYETCQPISNRMAVMEK